MIRTKLVCTLKTWAVTGLSSATMHRHCHKRSVYISLLCSERSNTCPRKRRRPEFKQSQTVSAPRASISTLDLLLRVLEPHHPAVAAVTTRTGSSNYFDRTSALRTHLMALRRAGRRPPSSYFSSRRNALCPRLGWASIFQCKSFCQSCQKACSYARSCLSCTRHWSRPMMVLSTRCQP